MYKIAVSGKANSGKNTFSSYLTEFLCDSHKIYAFADPIKEIILTMFPQANKSSLFGPSSRRKEIIPGAIDRDGQPLTYRKALTEIGSLGRSFNQNCWIDKMKDDFFKCNEEAYIISDLRFPNEYISLHSLGFFTVRIKRDSVDKIDDISETSQDGIVDDAFNFVYDNNGTIEDLRAAAMFVAARIKGNV